MEESENSGSIVLRIIWRFLLCLYAPFLYVMDFFENMITTPHEYADGEGWSFKRTKVTFLRLWYYY